MIVRGPHKAHYTVLANSVLRDDRLSFKARGVLVFILSQPPGYEITCDKLAEQGPDGITAVRSALQELKDTGYLSRERIQHSETGQFEWRSTVFEEPQDGLPISGKSNDGADQLKRGKSAGQPISGKPKDGYCALEGLEVPTSSDVGTPPSDTGRLIAHYVNEAAEIGVQPPEDMKARIGRDVKRLLVQGVDPIDVEIALGWMAKEHKTNGALSPLVMEAQAQRFAANGGRR